MSGRQPIRDVSICVVPVTNDIDHPKDYRHEQSHPLAGKRALVTGAARGIGAAIALKLAEDGAGVAITYEQSADKAEALVAEIQALGRNAAAIPPYTAYVAKEAAFDTHQRHRWKALRLTELGEEIERLAADAARRVVRDNFTKAGRREVGSSS